MTRHFLGLFFSALLSLLLIGGSAHAAGTPESFAPLVEKLTPAVVNISTKQKIKQNGVNVPGLPFMFQFPDDPKFDPFRNFMDQLQRGQKEGIVPKEREVTSLGSGFIIDPKGYVVTNNHVIAEADEIHVILHDDTSLDAKIIGRDPKTDLALLKVTRDKPLPYVKFGNSDTMRVGDWVLAIGNPFGLGGTVTAGIISARSRSINAGPFDDFLQTDAAINRGNSGGPMFNAQGEVIGINTAIFSPSGGNIGIGFAVPSAMAQPVLEQLREYGRTYRGWLGVKIQEVSEEVADATGLKKAKGALVLEITPDSPAAKSDLQPGDIITRFDGKEVEEMRLLPRIVAETKVGTEVAVDYWRNGKAKKTKVTLGELDESPAEEEHAQHTPKDTPTGVKTQKVAGLELAEVSPELRQRYRLKDSISGVIVLDIIPDSKAAKQNIRRGDLLIQVNTAKIKTLKEVVSALKAAHKEGREHALVRLKRGKDELFVTLPTTDAK